MLCFPLLSPPFPFQFLSRQHHAELKDLGLQNGNSHKLSAGHARVF